jgi:putative ABC transport system permease protein
MFKNYIKIAVRSLLKRKLYSVINIAGLAVGITFAGLIGSYVWGEFQVNRSLRHAGQQCLVQSRWKQENMGLPITTLAPIGPALRAAHPNLIANFYRFYGINATVSAGNNPFRESIQIGDSTVLNMFGFTLLHGNPRTALAGPNSVVITAEKALKFFGRTDVLNQTLMVETTGAGKQPFLITGVLRSLASNSVSQLQAGPTANELFMPVSSVRYFGGEAAMLTWQNQYIVTYVELQPGVTPQDLEKPLARLVAQNTPPELHKNLTAYVTPLTDYYLQSNNGLVWKMIVTLTAVALFILLMAVVNFVNISLGSSSSRLREIGVRKALGGLRQQLTVQFLSEALALTTVAAVLSVGLYALFRPLFSAVVGKPIPGIMDLPGSVGVGLLLLIVVVGLLAGSYPALYLSGYSSIDSLKGTGKTPAGAFGGSGLFRRGLVTVQFVIAIFVFVGALVVSRQITYFFTTDLGFKKEAVLTVSSLPRNWTPEGVSRMEAARDQFARLPGILSASLSFEIPNGNIGNSGSLYR